ncbi:MAG: GNAT family N-acetyltransferase [Bacteroidota bacterium]
MKFKNPLLLEGTASKRLFFRKVTASDFEEWLPFYNNPLSTQFWSGLPTNPREACQHQFDQIFERYEKDLGGLNALILKENSKLIGLCGLLIQKVDGQSELEIGYSVLPSFWRRGFAFEAAHKCKSHAMEHGLAKSLISIIHIDNIPSQKVALKNDMFLDKTTSYKNNPVHIFRVLL